MRSFRTFLVVASAWSLVFGLSVASGTQEIRLRLTAADVDCVDVPVAAYVDLCDEFSRLSPGEIQAELKREGARGGLCPGQIVKASDGKVLLWWIVPELTANSSSTWVATLSRGSQMAGQRVFDWQDKKGQYLDLLFDGRKVTRYMYAYDTSSPQRLFETYKPFHHVFDFEGRKLLTNGPDGVHPYLKDKIIYPHHRGIFIGWNRLEFGGQRYDLWHMPDVAQVHQRFLELVAGPVLARSKSLIHWNDKNGEPIITEERSVTVFRQSEIILLEFRTELKAVRADVYLDGDPEHGGFQYRAHNDVASGGKEVKATYLFHEDGINPRQDRDLPWVAMSYGLNGRRYTVLHVNHPSNPKETVYSAYRDYGRFGAFFKKQIQVGETLTLCYRIAITQGEMPQRQKPASIYSTFVHCPQAVLLER
jgi:hypothetical protein